MIVEKRGALPSFFWGGDFVLRVILCDDDRELLVRLEVEIAQILQDLRVKAKIHTFSDPSQISHQMLSSCDMAILDIDYDNASYNGMDAARRLREYRKDAIIIFVTNYIEYAPEGYEVQAFRYILKKELSTELRPYMQQAIAQIQASRETVKISVNGEIIDLPLEDILYFEVQQHSVTVHIKRDKHGKTIKTYSFYASLSELETKLEPQGFLRIHKSYLVNMRHIIRFQCREAKLTNGIILRVGEKSYSENKKKYLLWKGWH